MKKAFLILLALSFCLNWQQATAQSQAEAEMYEYKEAKKADAAGDYAKAVEWYLKAAEKGNTRAMNNIGVAYEYGEGVTKDYAKAYEWYLKAAQKGNEGSMHNVGNMFYYGYGVAQSFTKALEWFRKAADKGYVDSIHDIGYMYAKGEGVTQDYGKAMEWYRKSAEKGKVVSMRTIGDLYYNGNGVAQSYRQALEWYTKAADRDDASAQFKIGDMYRFGHLEGGWNEVLKWFQKAANNGHATANYLLGNFCYSGNIVERNFELAVAFYRRAIELGSIGAHFYLGNCYYNGYAVEKNYAEAAKHYLVAAQNDVVEAQSQLGYLYLNGEGVQKDYRQALHWSSKAADNGNITGLCNTGLIYGEGYGVAVDYPKAAKYYMKAAEKTTGDRRERYLKSVFDYTRKSAEAGNAESMYHLATYYLQGEGVDVNKDSALEWYRKSADKGYARAMGQLGHEYENNGNGGEQDLKTALEWYKKAERAGDTRGSSRIKILEQNIKETNYIARDEMGAANREYWSGNFAESLELYRKAANMGNVKAMKIIGDFYLEGDGVAKSESKAREWYQKSADAGYEEAKSSLRGMDNTERLRRLRSDSPRYALIGTKWKYKDITISFDFSDTSKGVMVSSPYWGKNNRDQSIKGSYTFDGRQGTISFADIRLNITVYGSDMSFKTADNFDFWDMATIALGGSVTTLGFVITGASGKDYQYENGTFRKQ